MPKKTTKKSSTKKSAKKETKQKGLEVPKSPINHFEIPFDDLGRIKKFYSEIFGWTLVDMPEMDYTMVYTDELDKNQKPITPGVVNGGFTKRNPIQVTPTLVMTVKNIKETNKKIQSFGCELLGDLISVGDMGLYQLFKDTEGNVLGVFQNL